MRRFAIPVTLLIVAPSVVLTAACDTAHTINASPSEMRFRKAGATMEIEAEAKNRRGLKAKGAVITYRSRDPQVASVGPSGTVTAVGHGTTTVEVVVDGTDVMEFVRVVVRLPEKIELRPGSTTCYIGGVKRLKAKVLDMSGEEIPNVDINWSSSDETKARVERGEVTGIDEGSAEITAEALGLTSTSTITVAWAPGQKQLIEMEKRAGRGGRGGGGGGGGGRGGSKEGGAWDPRLSMFDD